MNPILNKAFCLLVLILVLVGCSSDRPIHPRVKVPPSDDMSFSAWVIVIFIGVAIVIGVVQKVSSFFRKK